MSMFHTDPGDQLPPPRMPTGAAAEYFRALEGWTARQADNPYLPADYAARLAEAERTDQAEHSEAERVEKVRGPDIPYTLASYAAPSSPGADPAFVALCLVNDGAHVEVTARESVASLVPAARVTIPFAAFKLLLGQAASTLAAFENGGFFADRLVKTLLPIEVANLMYPRTLAEWHEDMGPKLWWTFPIEEPPYCGSPLDEDWPGFPAWFGAPDATIAPYPAYLTHFTDIPVVKDPT